MNDSPRSLSLLRTVDLAKGAETATPAAIIG